MDIFHSAAIKLTLWYLGIIMLVSILFSVALYHVSADELETNVSRQVSYFNGFLSPLDLNDYSQLKQNLLAQDESRLKDNLVSLNILVFFVGGVISYGLARGTLRPIEEALEAQKRFAADASHELRTPLTAMQSEIEVALRDPKLTKTEAVALLGSSLEEVGKLKGLSEGLLRLANSSGRVRSGKEVSLKEIAQAAAARLDKAAEAKKIKLDFKLKELSTIGDKQNLTDLVAILLDNAIKYSPAGGQVTLNTARRGRAATISVKDHGVGIAEADLPRIFERFYRADASRARAGSGEEGYGLGLSLARKIAEAHKGHIEVKSTIGKGSTFTVFLPSA